jgi:hypothetical protein
MVEAGFIPKGKWVLENEENNPFVVLIVNKADTLHLLPVGLNLKHPSTFTFKHI